MGASNVVPVVLNSSGSWSVCLSYVFGLATPHVRLDPFWFSNMILSIRLLTF